VCDIFNDWVGKDELASSNPYAKFFREIIRTENTIFQVLTEPNDPFRVNCTGITAAPLSPLEISWVVSVSVGRWPNSWTTRPHNSHYFCLLSLGRTRRFAFFIYIYISIKSPAAGTNGPCAVKIFFSVSLQSTNGRTSWPYCD